MKTFAKIMGVILGILMIISGVYCLFTPAITYLMVGYIVGLCMVFDSVARFIGWIEIKKEGHGDALLLTAAILDAVFGFFILNDAALQVGLDAFFVYYFAIWLFISGIIIIVKSFKVHSMYKKKEETIIGANWYVLLITGLLVLLFGILCMIRPIVMASFIGIFIGLGVIFAGANLITEVTAPDGMLLED